MPTVPLQKKANRCGIASTANVSANMSYLLQDVVISQEAFELALQPVDHLLLYSAHTGTVGDYRGAPFG